MVIDDQTYHLSSGCGIDFNAHEKHGYINCGTSDAVVCFFLI